MILITEIKTYTNITCTVKISSYGSYNRIALAIYMFTSNLLKKNCGVEEHFFLYYLCILKYK